jgi:hypothetical protein
MAGQYINPKPHPIIMPTEIVKKAIEVACDEMPQPIEAIIAPAIAHARQPNLFDMELAIGPAANISPVKSERIHETSAFVDPNSYKYISMRCLS